MFQDLIADFEKRSRSLKRWAGAFLFFIGVLLAFGVYIFFFASSVTATDIGGRNFDERMTATLAQENKASSDMDAAQKALAEHSKTCVASVTNFFSRWPVTDALKPDGGAFRSISFLEDQLITGDILAANINSELAKPENEQLKVFGLQIMLPRCINVFLVLPRERYAEVTEALKGHDIIPDAADIARLVKQRDASNEKFQYLQQVYSTIYMQKVQAEASGGVSASSTDKDGGAGEGASNALLIRLLQTSITRFGVLAVVGFLVSLLVSLYRYNIRLAAFYMARADTLRLKVDDMTVSDFAILSAALSPNLEFGKSPQPPIAQLVDLVKSAKDAK